MHEIVRVDRAAAHLGVDFDDSADRLRQYHLTAGIGRRAVVDLVDAGLQPVDGHAGHAAGNGAGANCHDVRRFGPHGATRLGGFFGSDGALDDGDIVLVGHVFGCDQLPVAQIDLAEYLGQVLLGVGDLQLTSEAAGQAHDHDARHARGRIGDHAEGSHVTSTPEYSLLPNN